MIGSSLKRLKSSPISPPAAQVIHPALISSAHLREFRRIGVIAAVQTHVLKALPARLSPLLMQLLVHDWNVKSLTKDFMETYAPDVVRLIMDWREFGPNHPLTDPQWCLRMSNLGFSVR